MAETHLNDISKVYLDQVVEKKDDSYLETDMKKRQENNEKARKELAKGPQMKNPHFESVEEVEQVDEADSLAAMQARREKRLAAQRKKMGTSATGQDFGHDYGISSDERKKRQKAEFDAFVGRGKKTQKESLDPVGQEDGDVNNDGKKDKTDKYLMKRRKAIAASINKKKVKESFSDWRTELSEVIGDTDVKKKSETPKIKEGNVDNASKIKINPEIKEAIEEIGGTLLEMVEVDEMDYILESVYIELIEEGFTEEDVEFGIEQALVQDLEEVTSPAKVAALKMKKATYTVKPETKEEPKKSLKDRIKSAAKNAIVGAGRVVGSMVKKKADAQSGVGKTKKKIGHYVKRAKELARQGYEQGRGPVEKKPTTYRGAGVGRKEKIGEDLVNEQDSAPNEKQMLAKKKQMMLKQQLLDKQRIQMQQQGKLPAGHRVEELSVDKQMKISQDYNRMTPEQKKAANKKVMGNVKKVTPKKDTRTDSQKMTDAVGKPRMGSSD